MAKRTKLTRTMTEAQFDNGYWFATEIKAFAKELGIPNSSRLRKDELENLIRHFIKTGKIRKSQRKNVVKTGIRDL
ncbi:MAG: Rho termination factor N-terminal domain-containing protein, partial [Leptospiraceae bacterium]|nr:Rho termination factor N-terminal domain-containing protein [Leptospiraceae bacterium]